MLKLAIQFVTERRELRSKASMVRNFSVAMSTSLLALYVSLLILNLSNVSLSQSHSICNTFPTVPLFVFGDSFFDVGTNNYINTTFVSNVPPYGETYFKYPSGRFSDGRVIPDFIAKYAKLPLLPPYLFPEYLNDVNQYIHYGVNFASAGAGALFDTHQGKALNLQTETNQFTKVSNQIKQNLGAVEAEKLLSRAVNIFSIGGNDYIVRYEAEISGVISPYTEQEYVDIVIGNISTTLKKIYKDGGRKFGFLNVPPLNCLPLERRHLNSTTISACLEGEASRLARLHNNALPKLLEKLEKELKGFKYSITDYYSAFVELLTNPSQYGFKDGSTACCGGGPFGGDDSCGKKGYELCDNPNEHIFFDSVHPTEKAAERYAKIMWNNVKQLFHKFEDYSFISQVE